MRDIVGSLGRLIKPRHYTHRAEYLGVMGTDASLIIESDTQSQAETAEEILWREVNRLCKILDFFDEQSELNIWQTGNVPQRLSPDLSSVLEAARYWHEHTSGVINPAVENISAVWKKAAKIGKLPTENEILEALVKIGKLPTKDSSGKTPPPNCLLNFNAIAKGFIIDRAAEAAFRSAGVNMILLSVGGDMRHIGSRPVSVEVANPSSRSENTRPIKILEIQNSGLATSGHVWRGFDIDGKWYSHLIDPRTGLPVDNNASLGATVISPDCMSADALATAVSISPNLAGKHWQNSEIFILN